MSNSNRETTTSDITTTATTSTRTRARRPVTLRVRSTGEKIRRVPIERSGYRVVRYEGRYHTIRGGSRTSPYIVGSPDGDDVNGRA